jgi:hypothetical protein
MLFWHRRPAARQLSTPLRARDGRIVRVTPARAAEQQGVLASGDGAGDLVGLELHDGFGVGVRQSQRRASTARRTAGALVTLVGGLARAWSA